MEHQKLNKGKVLVDRTEFIGYFQRILKFYYFASSTITALTSRWHCKRSDLAEKSC